jgi:hypothetical protein
MCGDEKLGWLVELTIQLTLLSKVVGKTGGREFDILISTKKPYDLAPCSQTASKGRTEVVGYPEALGRLARAKLLFGQLL